VSAPLVTVAAPGTTPYRYGLFSAAAVVDAADQREFLAGVQWEPQCVDAPAPTTPAANPDPDGDPAAMMLPGGVPLVQAGVIRLYAGLTGQAAGRDDLLERARQALGLVEQQSLEHYVWTGDAGTSPALADAGTSVLAGTAATPVPLPQGVGLLEAFLADRTGSLGVLWAPRWLSGWFATGRLVRVDGPRLAGPLGNPLVFAQTTGVGPGGAPAGAGEAWLYATGAVMVRRSTVLLPRLADVLDRTDNEVFAVAERFYTVGWSCAVAAVKVKLPSA
jgi:hypothetical protein